MATYAIGDVQGCYDPLVKLLDLIQFDPSHDVLWFTGDLVNRGPDSLEVLRFIKSLGNQHKIVLGNHDLHLIALAYHIKKSNAPHSLNAVLTADDRHELIDWLRSYPLIHYDEAQGYVLVHAGLPPFWSIRKAKALAQEVETVLAGPQPYPFLQAMYGNQRDLWRDELQGMVRLRCITNYLTRMRYCYLDGSLDLHSKGTSDSAELIPWFNLPHPQTAHLKILFGHWASLDGETEISNIYALDTGCGGWGLNCLTAMRLEDEQKFMVSCK